MALKTLGQSDVEHAEKWRSSGPRKQSKGDTKPVLNGIQCPGCHAELMDTHPNVTITSAPPRKEVHCPSCGWKGRRIA